MAESWETDIKGMDLVKLNLQRIRIEQDLKLLDLTKKDRELARQKLKDVERLIASEKNALKIGEKYARQVTQEIAAKKDLQKIYEEQVKVIKQSGATIKDQIKAIENWQKTTGARNTEATFGKVFSSFKNFKFGQGVTDFVSAGRWAGVLSNTVAALGGPVGVVVAGFGLLAKATNTLYNTFVVTSARMRNTAYQQLGVGVENRNLFGGSFLKEWANRTLLGFTAQEQIQQFSTVADILRLNPDTNKALYESTMGGFQAVQRIWGTDTKTLGRIEKAFRQIGVSGESLAPKFDTLMRSIEGTGFTTSEFTNFLSQDVMYLKNFGVNLDTYSKELMRYGNLYRQERISASGLRAGGFQGEQTGNLAYLAQGMLRAGLISEKELGAGLGSSITAQSGAMRAYLGKGITIERISKLFDFFQQDPAIRKLLEEQGAFTSPYALKEVMGQLNIPGLGTVKDVIGSMTPQDLYRAMVLKDFQTTSGKGGLTDYSADKLRELAEKSAADTSDLVERLLRSIAALILEYAGVMKTGKPSKDLPAAK